MEAPSEHQSLKQKWKDHYENRNFQPSNRQANLGGVLVASSYVLAIVCIMFGVLIPSYWSQEPNARLLAHCVATVLVVEILVNWVLCTHRKHLQVTPDMSPRCSKRETPASEDKPTWQPEVVGLPYGWSSCARCQVDTPPRSFHCQFCDMCVLKRDHHSFFIGTCVGFSNTRRFLALMLHLALFMGFTAGVAFAYLHQTLPLFTVEGLAYIPPVSLVFWIGGTLSGSDFAFILFIYASLGGCLVFGLFFGFETVLALKGQTPFEMTRGIYRYQLSKAENFRLTFGDFGLVHFLLPLPTSLPGNGIHFQLNNTGRRY